MMALVIRSMMTLKQSSVSDLLRMLSHFRAVIEGQLSPSIHSLAKALEIKFFLTDKNRICYTLRKGVYYEIEMSV